MIITRQGVFKVNRRFANEYFAMAAAFILSMEGQEMLKGMKRIQSAQTSIPTSCGCSAASNLIIENQEV
jgi:hypothetical protein